VPLICMMQLLISASAVFHIYKCFAADRKNFPSLLS
jgi:hypothetical protein